MQAREQRSRTQSLYLHPDSTADTPHDFRVFGSSGRLYHVQLTTLVDADDGELRCTGIACSCPDWAYNGGLVCKHAIFVTRQVLGVPMHDHAWTVRDYGEITGRDVQARVQSFWERRNQHGSAGGGAEQRDEECGICIDAIDATHAVFTCPQCRHCIHQACFVAWQRQLRRQGRAVTCPFCRFRC